MAETAPSSPADDLDQTVLAVVSRICHQDVTPDSTLRALDIDEMDLQSIAFHLSAIHPNVRYGHMIDALRQADAPKTVADFIVIIRLALAASLRSSSPSV
jgi:hypothetical protein